MYFVTDFYLFFYSRQFYIIRQLSPK